MMEHNTVLYISDRANRKHNTIVHNPEEANRNHPVLAALQETGCEVVSTDSTTVGAALLYAIHSATAVVLDIRSSEEASFEVAHSLRQIRPLPLMDQRVREHS